MENEVQLGGDDIPSSDEQNQEFVNGTQSLINDNSSSSWTKGVTNADSRVNIWSLNGYGEPVFTGGMYHDDEARILEQTVKDYCASKSVSISELIDTAHNKTVRGAWAEIAQCLPHRTVLSVYRRAMRQFHGMTRGEWSKEEVSSLFNLVDLHGHKWKIVQDKLGRSATDCRNKFFDLNDQFERGKWSKKNVELLLQRVRVSLNVPRRDMDVREINQWTLEHNTKIPWTAISCKVNRRRQDCYFKWKQMSKRSNKKALELDLEPVPMYRESHKFDVRSEYRQWRAEQDPKHQQKYIEEFVHLPFLQDEYHDAKKQQDIQLLDYIIESKATRPSQLSFAQRGDNAKERWEELVDKYATDADLDLPLWKLAKVLKDVASRATGGDDDNTKPTETKQKTKSGKKRKRKKKSNAPSKSIKTNILGVPVRKLKQSIREIVNSTNLDDITVKGVRTLLEKEHKIDLSAHKRLIKRMVIDAV